MSVTVGQEAPDFELMNTEGGKTKLSAFRGQKNVLLLFFPFAFSRKCSGEFCQLRDDNADLASTDDLEVIGISVDSPWALTAWKKAENYPNSFVSDFWPYAAIGGQYGTLNEHGLMQRHSFLIDKDGIVRYTEANSSADPRDQGAWRKALADLG